MTDRPSVKATVPATFVDEIADFVAANTPYLQGIGNVGVRMAQHIREKWGVRATDRAAAEAPDPRDKTGQSKWDVEQALEDGRTE